MQAAGPMLRLVGVAGGGIPRLDLFGDAFSEAARGVASMDDVALARVEKAASPDLDPGAGRPSQDRRCRKDAAGTGDLRAGAFVSRRFGR